jgi:flagellar secretion chaperone FliS
MTSMSAARYVQDSISTASPGRLLVMLYDRLALDLARAGDALEARDRQAAHARLIHAQDIVAELAGSLDHSAGWAGSQNLAALYAWLGTELVQVNVRGDRAKLRACQDVVEPLRESWHQALEATSAQSSDSRLVG